MFFVHWIWREQNLYYEKRWWKKKNTFSLNIWNPLYLNKKPSHVDLIKISNTMFYSKCECKICSHRSEMLHMNIWCHGIWWLLVLWSRWEVQLLNHKWIRHSTSFVKSQDYEHNVQSSGSGENLSSSPILQHNLHYSSMIHFLTIIISCDSSLGACTFNWN